MRRRKFVIGAIFVAAAVLAGPASAQFSPFGILGAAARPLREMLGRFGHFPHSRHARAAEATRPTAAPAEFGVVGPAGWPAAYEDVLGFTFWPDRFAEQMRGHGIDVIAAAVIGPPRVRETRVATTGAAPTDSNAGDCRNTASALVGWPMSHIEETTKLTTAQHRALDKLDTAVNNAIKNIRAACRDTVSLSPRDRLAAAVQALWAVRDAGIDVRAPLKDFYNSLNDEQKVQFAWKQPQASPEQDGNAADSAMARRYQICAASSEQAAQHLLQQIEQTVQPRKEQEQSLQALRKAIEDMTKLVTAPCAQGIPENPVARLDAADDQIAGLSYAATSMELALNAFYSQLDTKQKAKFDSLGR